MTRASDAPRPCSSTIVASIRLQIKVARIFNTYGPRMHPNDGRVVSNFMVQALKDEPITIYGDGSQTRSFCYVDDLVEGLMRLMATADDVTGPINLGNPNECTILELAERVIALTNTKSKIIMKPLPDRRSAPAQARHFAGEAPARLAPTVSLDEGLRRQSTTSTIYFALTCQLAMPEPIYVCIAESATPVSTRR